MGGNSTRLRATMPGQKRNFTVQAIVITSLLANPFFIPLAFCNYYKFFSSEFSAHERCQAHSPGDSFSLPTDQLVTPPPFHLLPFLLSPRQTRPLRSSGMVSSTHPSAAASFTERAFLCSRLSKWKRAREMKRLFLLWSFVCLEVPPGLPESR